MINEKLLKEIKEYCELNNIEDFEKEINKFLRIGFNIERYGSSPFSFLTEDKVKQYVVEQPLEEEKKEDIVEPINIEKPKKRIRIIKND